MISFRKHILILFCVAIGLLNMLLCINMYHEHDGYYTFGTILFYSPIVNLVFLILGIIMMVKLKRWGNRSDTELVVYTILPFACAAFVFMIGLLIGGGGC